MKTKLVRQKKEKEKVGSPDVVTAKAGHKEKGVEPTVRKYPLKGSVIASGETIHIGIDVSAGDLAVCVLGPGREILAQEKIPHTQQAVRALLARLPDCTVEAVYESGPTGYVLLRWLRELKCQAFMVASSRVPVESGNRVKTDKRDAVKLATLLACGQLDEINDLTDEQYADRQLVRARTQAVRKKTAICLQIKSLMLMHHIQLPCDINATWSKRMRTWLREYDTSHPYLNAALREQLHWLDDASASVRRLSALCARLALEPRHAESAALLRSIPGFGVVTVAVWLTELPDLVKRFKSGESLARYLGLVPTEHSTGQSQGRRGHLTHDGNGFVRSALVEASWRLIRRDARMRARYQEIARRRGKKKAIVAIARHLAVSIHAMFRDGTKYRCGKKEEQSLAA